MSGMHSTRATHPQDLKPALTVVVVGVSARVPTQSSSFVASNPGGGQHRSSTNRLNVCRWTVNAAARGCLPQAQVVSCLIPLTEE